MPRRLTADPHLAPEEVGRRYRAAADPVARSHWQIVWRVAMGRPCAEAAAATGYGVDWVREVVRRWNAGGPAALGDRRRGNPGGAAVLDGAARAALRAALAGPAPDGGLWTCRTVAAWIGARIGRPVHEARGWEAMRALGFSPQRPRPREARADPAAQDAFKKGGSRPPSTRSRRPTRAPR